MPHTTVTAMNNQPIEEGYLTHQTTLFTLKIGLFHQEEISFYIISTPTNPIILGLPWLHIHDPQLSCQNRQLIHWSSHSLAHCMQNPLTHHCLTTSIKSPDSQLTKNIPVECIKTSRKCPTKEKLRGYTHIAQETVSMSSCPTQFSPSAVYIH